MSKQEFITADVVAQIAGLNSAASFLIARKRLERDHDFPLPLPTCLRPLKWRRSGVEAWLTSQGQAGPKTAILPMNERTLLHEAKTA